MPMKTNTPPNPETQGRIQQLKLGVDWHVEPFRTVRMCDGQSPQPAQGTSPVLRRSRLSPYRCLAGRLRVRAANGN